MNAAEIGRRLGGRKFRDQLDGNPKEFLWCGEGDLNSQHSRRICKLLIPHSATTARKVKKAGSGHNLGTQIWGEPLR